MNDPVPLAQALLRCNSVTPADGGAQAVLAEALIALGFEVHHLPFGTTPNLFARRGTTAPHLCFAGHTDVVPPGGATLDSPPGGATLDSPPGATTWTSGPFDAEIRDGILYGRGACDMKGAIAAFIAAIPPAHTPGQGSISLLITGDEEGPATDGTTRVLDWMAEHGHIPDFCLVGEPTNPEALGEVIKIGRRGSLNARIAIHGTQGHVAYPHKADNPVHRLVHALAALTAAPLDAGSTWFEPSTLQVTSIDVGNTATNVVPATARAMLNIRFNDHHSGAALEAWLRATLAQHADRFELEVTVSGESFLTQPGPLVDTLQAAIARACGRTPRLDTGGGTSDARFITRFCPVAEFGLVGSTMHQVDECVPLAELHALTGAYRAVIAAFAA